MFLGCQWLQALASLGQDLEDGEIRQCGILFWWDRHVCVYIYIICISNNHIYIYYMPQNISSHSSWRGQKTLWVWWFDGLVFHRKFHHTRLQRRASSRSRRSSGWSSYEARETWGSPSTISAVSHECQLVPKVFVGTVSFTLFHRDCSISMHFCDL